MAGISDKAIKSNYAENNYRFNGIELNTVFDIDMYDAFYRNLDPQIGRFWQIDPVANFNEAPYTAMQNNPILKMDWLGNYFTFVNSATEDRFKRLRKENNDRINAYVNELSSLDLNSTDKKVQKQIKQLTDLIDMHGDLNSQWNQMDASNVEFFVSNEDASPKGFAGVTKYNPEHNRIDIKAGKDDNDIGLMAHELRHGFGYLNGELMATSDGTNPFSDQTDEIAAYNVQYLFNDRGTANLVVEGYYGSDWFKRTMLSQYSFLIGREDNLNLNTAASIFLKYNKDAYIKSFIMRNSSNANLTAGDAINAANALDIKANRPVNFIYGAALENRK